MLSKSKMKKLGRELKGFGLTYDKLREATGKSEPYLREVLRGDSYDKDTISALIKLRNEKVLEATELEAQIG